MNGSGEAEEGGKSSRCLLLGSDCIATTVGPNVETSKINGKSLTNLSWFRMRQNQDHAVSTYLYRNNSNPEEGIQALI